MSAFAGGPGKNVRWQKDLKTAHKVAQSEGKPILLVFGADWCTYCHKLEKNVLDQPATAAYINANFVAVHLDADHDKRVTEILEVESLPCTVVLSPNADLLGRFEGYAEATKYTANLEKSVRAHQELRAAKSTGTTVTR
ncbi:MAG: thioredoxin family protein [Planctomycetaceae bacterium]